MFISAIAPIVSGVNELSATLAAATEAKPEGKQKTALELVEQAANYLSATLGCVDSAVDAYENLIDGELSDAMKKWRRNLHDFQRLLTAAHTKQYAKAATLALALVDNIAVDPCKEDDDKDKDCTFKTRQEGLRKLLVVGAEIASSDTEDGMKRAIEAAVLPVGGYRLKQRSNGRVYLNAYMGAAGGFEHLMGDKHRGDGVELEDGGLNSFAAFAPIGIELDIAGNSGCSASLFASLLDLGALASFRLSQTEASNGDGTETITAKRAPEVSLRQVFSPGIFVVTTFANKPIALGAGAQVLPQLRKLTTVDEPNGITQDAWRVTAFLAIDIPLWRF